MLVFPPGGVLLSQYRSLRPHSGIWLEPSLRVAPISGNSPRLRATKPRE